MKLRALRKLLDKGGQIYISDDGNHYRRSTQHEWSDINYFGFTPENSRLIEYEDRKECSKHIDRLISKHGADALISEIFNKGDSNEDLTKGGREGPSSEASEEGPSSTDSSTDTADHSDGMDCQGSGLSEVAPGSNAGSGQSGGGDYETGVEPKDGKHLSQVTFEETSNSECNGDSPGVGSQVDANGKDACGPMQSQSGGLKTNNLRGAGHDSGLNDGGMHPHPLSPPDGFEELVRESDMRDDADTEQVLEDAAYKKKAHRRDNPGGFVDMAMAALNSKKERKQAQSIARAVDRYFDALEVGVGVESTPRIDAKRLVKEITGKSYRMSRTGKEEMGTGLKLVMVDISPSCSAVRDKAMAAAIALANNDPNIVLFAHFNGWVTRRGAYILGNRQSEIPVTDPDKRESSSKAFIEKLKTVSGVIAFGDDDAEWLFEQISEVTNFVWLSCMDARSTRYFSERHSSAVVVPNVLCARTAVHGLRLAVKRLNGILC